MQLVRTRVMTIEDNAWSLQNLWRQVHEKKIRALARLTPAKSVAVSASWLVCHCIRFQTGTILTVTRLESWLIAHSLLLDMVLQDLPSRPHAYPAHITSTHNHLAGVCETVDFGEHSGTVVVTVVSCASHVRKFYLIQHCKIGLVSKLIFDPGGIL